MPSLLANEANFLTDRVWQPATNPPAFGIAALLWTTVLASAVALLLAVPVAIGVALFITQYAPRRLAKPVGYVDRPARRDPVDHLRPLGHPGARAGHRRRDSGVRRSSRTTSAGSRCSTADVGVAQGTVFLAAIVLAIMILPIITAISREVFDQTPLPNKEAALALGATRWEMIRIAVLPFGRPGVISASMLGLGRALGETIAVTIILSQPSSPRSSTCRCSSAARRSPPRSPTTRASSPRRRRPAPTSPPAWCCSSSPSL